MTTPSSPGNERRHPGTFVTVQVRLTVDQLYLLQARGLVSIEADEAMFSQRSTGLDQFVQRSIGTYLDLEQLVREGGELLLRRPREQPRPLRLDFSPQQTAAGLPIQASAETAALGTIDEFRDQLRRWLERDIETDEEESPLRRSDEEEIDEYMEGAEEYEEPTPPRSRRRQRRTQAERTEP
jgi:hypothetical protein